MRRRIAAGGSVHDNALGAAEPALALAIDIVDRVSATVLGEIISDLTPAAIVENIISRKMTTGYG